MTLAWRILLMSLLASASAQAASVCREYGRRTVAPLSGDAKSGSNMYFAYTRGSLGQPGQALPKNRFLTDENFFCAVEAHIRFLFRSLIGPHASLPGAPIQDYSEMEVRRWLDFAKIDRAQSQYMTRVFLFKDITTSGTDGLIKQFASTFFSHGLRASIYRPMNFTEGQANTLGNRIDQAWRDLNGDFHIFRHVAESAGYTLTNDQYANDWVEMFINRVPKETRASGRALYMEPPGTAAQSVRDTLNLAGRFETALERLLERPMVLRTAIRIAAAEEPETFASILAPDIGGFSGGVWSFRNAYGAAITNTSYGVSVDTPVAADWNGDGYTDYGVYRQGAWYLDTNGNPGWQGGDTAITFGVPSDIPVAGDWDGNGRDDMGVFRNGIFYLDSNSSLGWQGNDTTLNFGVAGDTPFAGDFNGDGKDEVGVMRETTLYLDSNGTLGWQGNDTTISNFCPAGCKPVVADFNMDGRDEVGYYFNGTWRLDTNGIIGIQADDATVNYDIGSAIPFVAQDLR